MAAGYRPWPWRTRIQDSQRKSWLREEGKWDGVKKGTNEKEQQPFIHSPACPLSSLLFPLHPSISQGRCSLGPKRMKVKEEGEEKKPAKLSVEHHTCVENRLCPVREGKGRLRRRKNKVGECIREDSCSLAAINEGPKRHVHPHTLLPSSTHTSIHSSIVWIVSLRYKALNNGE